MPSLSFSEVGGRRVLGGKTRLPGDPAPTKSMVTTGRRERKRKRMHLLLPPASEGTRTVILLTPDGIQLDLLTKGSGNG